MGPVKWHGGCYSTAFPLIVLSSSWSPVSGIVTESELLLLGFGSLVARQVKT